MIISTPVSLGELVDKISILHIKNKNIKDNEKLKLIRAELKLLTITLDDYLKKNDIQEFLDALIKINSELWIIEDEIRDCERKKQFDENFIKLARSVYINNDQRSEIKLEINNYTGSKIKEIKEYTNY